MSFLRRDRTLNCKLYWYPNCSEHVLLFVALKLGGLVIQTTCRVLTFPPTFFIIIGGVHPFIVYCLILVHSRRKSRENTWAISKTNQFANYIKLRKCKNVISTIFQGYRERSIDNITSSSPTPLTPHPHPATTIFLRSMHNERKLLQSLFSSSLKSMVRLCQNSKKFL